MDSGLQKIKAALIKHKITENKIDKFFAYCNEESFDFKAIQIDVANNDPTQSLLYDFITNELKDAQIFFIITSAVHPSSSSFKIEAQKLALGIVDGSAVTIPDDIEYKYYESIQGITYILNHNRSLIDKQFVDLYTNVFWDFWKEFVTDSPVSYESISSDLKYKHGQTIICMNEHPPSERALPILERIVYELRLQRLDGNKNMEKREMCKEYVHKWYKQHLYGYIVNDDIINASVLCKLNEDESSLIDIQFELFTVLIDVYDVMNVCDDDIKLNDIENMIDINAAKNDKKHFGSKLTVNDATTLCNAIKKIKCDILPAIKGNVIDGEMRMYQLISLGFIKFIKTFICSTNDGLYVFNHLQKKKKKKQEIVLDFNNDNFPLQFDLVILNKNGKRKHKYFFDDKTDQNNHMFQVAILQIVMDHCVDNQTFVDGIKDAMVKAFRDVLLKTKAGLTNKKNKKDKDKKKKRDDRYVIVVDTKCNTLYLYPPFIDYNINIDEEKKRERKENKFSLIGYESNHLTNFYLTASCLIPSTICYNNNVEMDIYGVDQFEFVFSAHFYPQKDWYKHPKLKLYQYFNGGGMRFFEQHLTSIWTKYFKCQKDILTDKDIKDLCLFDDILDLNKCDEIYRKWYRDIRHSIMNNKKT